MPYTPAPGSHEEAAIALIQKKGWARSHEIARSLDIDHEAVIELLSEASSCGLLVACDIVVADLPPGKEYRPSAGMAVSFKEFRVKPASSPSRGAAPVTTAIKNQEGPMSTSKKAGTSRGTGLKTLLAAIGEHGPIDSVDLAKHTGVAANRVSKALSYQLSKGTIVNRKKKRDGYKGAIAEYATPAQAKAAGWSSGNASSRETGDTSRKIGKSSRENVEKLQKTASTKTAKVQRNTAKAQSAKSPAGALPPLPVSAYPPGALPLEPAPGRFRCGLFSDGALLIDGDFELVAGGGVALSVTETRHLVAYLRKLGELEAAR